MESRQGKSCNIRIVIKQSPGPRIQEGEYKREYNEGGMAGRHRQGVSVPEGKKPPV